MKRQLFWGALVLGVAVGLGVFFSGLFLGRALYRARSDERVITVRGVAEREVDANLAIWPITFSITSNDLGTLQDAINAKRATVGDFLVASGFDSAEISYAAPKIQDLRAQVMYDEKKTPEFRYVAQVTVTTRTSKIAKVKSAIEKSASLVGRGITLSAENWDNPTEYLFTKLNEIKPEMIGEATKNAREAALKFSKDSGSRLGGIRSATQGLFEITNRDRNSPERKVVRVVTTVSYLLKD